MSKEMLVPAAPPCAVPSARTISIVSIAAGVSIHRRSGRRCWEIFWILVPSALKCLNNLTLLRSAWSGEVARTSTLLAISVALPIESPLWLKFGWFRRSHVSLWWLKRPHPDTEGSRRCRWPLIDMYLMIIVYHLKTAAVYHLKTGITPLSEMYAPFLKWKRRSWKILDRSLIFKTPTWE